MERNDFDDLEHPEWKKAAALLVDNKNIKERVPREYRLQVAIINHLTGRVRMGKEWVRVTPAFHGLFITHIYQGRDESDGFLLKNMGVVPGVADLLCIWKYGFGFIEVKTEKGYLSPQQKKFKGFCISTNVLYEIARTVQDAHNILIKWGLRPIHHSIKEPDLRSDTQKKQDAFDMYKP